MSTVERNKGTLICAGIDTENLTEETLDELREEGFMILDGEVYEVLWEVKREEDCSHFVEMKETPTGGISFHTMHYNGVTCLEELLEEGLNKL
jgi:hypothetical protein